MEALQHPELAAYCAVVQYRDAERSARFALTFFGLASIPLRGKKRKIKTQKS
jgi:hypothetical protein